MDRRHAITCFLFAIVLLGDFAVAADDYCFEEYQDCVICTGFLCKAGCWVNAKLYGSDVKVKKHYCTGSMLKHRCHCYYCTHW
ncbi:hypothetical protein BRADI_1g63973v3 [Brachypodium distachyon]|uniref:Uncharacterized protein n=1 Tax=Brachypodium distachyon TaxID=15368 RepID=A0A0Q3SAF9_BRADI|nr:hypothetical protein BRADI_1g63973v3 [Brachypodium distachyon]